MATRLDSPHAESHRAVGQDDLSYSSIPSNAPMARSANLRPAGFKKGIAQRPVKFKTRYAPEPTLEEYKTFPPALRLENDNRPAEEILKVKGAKGPKKQRKYLVHWHPHPFTGQDFEPTWRSHFEITSDLLDSWDEEQRARIQASSSPHQHNEYSPDQASYVSTALESSPGRARKRRRLDSEEADSPGKENSSSDIAQPRKSKKIKRVISDGSSDVEEKGRTQPNNTQKAQSTLSSGINSLHSPPPEVEDSQEAVHKPWSSISVVVPLPPTSSRREKLIPISSSFETQASQVSHAESTLGFNSSGAGLVSDYPTPESVQVNSPLIPDQQSPLFFPENTSTPPIGSPLVSQTRNRTPSSPFAASRQASEVLATQVTNSYHSNSVQVSASGEVLQTQEVSATGSLPSAQPHAGLTSPIHETQASLGEELTTIHHSSVFRPPPQPPTKPQLQRSLYPSAGPGLSALQQSFSSVITSQFKTQISPSQPQQQRLSGSLLPDNSQSLSSQLQDATFPSPRPPPRTPRKHPGTLGTITSARQPRSDSISLLIPLKTTAPPVAMAASSQRSSPRTGRAARAAPSPRIMNEAAIAEQSVQYRATRGRNGPSVLPVEAPVTRPIIPQILEPTPIQLATRASNPTLKIEPDAESSSMQIDVPSTSEVSSWSEQFNNRKLPPTSSLQIQQSIEMDEPDKENSTQDSRIPILSEVQENGQLASSNQGLMPNYPILLPREFAIPLHAEGKTQSAYRDIVQSKQKAMSKYLRRGSSSSTPSSSGLTTSKTEALEMAELIGKLDAIVTMLDLGYEGMLTQHSYSGSQLAKWAVKASSKFAFVKELIDYIRQYPMWAVELVIFARAGHTQNLLEHFLSSGGVSFTSYTDSGEAEYANGQQRTSQEEASRGTALSGLIVHLVAGGQKPQLRLRTGKSLIIAFDNSFDPRSEYVLDLRSADSRAENDSHTPVIHLLVTNSAEHIERCLPVNMPSPQRNRLLVQSTLQATRDVGKLLSGVNEITLEYYSYLSKGTRIIDDDLMKQEQVFQKMPDFHLQRLARQVGKELLENGQGFQEGWSTHPAMPALELVEIAGLVTQQIRLPSPSPLPASPVGTPALRKRLLDGDGLDTPEGSKRQRMTPIPGTSPHEHSEAAHIIHLHHSLKAAKDEIAKEKLLRMGAEEARDSTQKQLNEWRQSVSDLQTRLEYHRDSDHKARTQVKQLKKDAERFTQLRERDASNCNVLKAQITKLTSDLAAARQSLLSGGGDTATLETARTEAQTATAALAKSDRDLATAKQQGEYFRTAYQETMATGRQHQADAEALQSRIAGLEIDARDEKRRLKLVNFDEAAAVHLARIERLETEHNTLQKMVRRLNAENLTLKAGAAGAGRGVSTRASSVQPVGGPPGSPRAGGVREARSRGGSPVPGVLGLGGGRTSALRHERS